MCYNEVAMIVAIVINVESVSLADLGAVPNTSTHGGKIGIDVSANGSFFTGNFSPNEIKKNAEKTEKKCNDMKKVETEKEVKNSKLFAVLNEIARRGGNVSAAAAA
jgi:hypothetical protein